MLEKSLTELREYLLKNLGLNFNKNQEGELYKKISDASTDFNYKNPNDFIAWVLKSELNIGQVEKLASYLTIGETYFLREIKALNFLEYNYLPQLIKERKGKNQSMRIWCAGCASGEEPYSISIMLSRIIPDIKNWNINILATDINSKFLEKARKGIYTKWSFRKLSDSFKEIYFTQLEKGLYQINSEFQERVTFAYQNLAADSYPSLINNTNAMDIIFCRNVLIYFSEEGIKEVTQRMFKSLVPGGVFFVSPVEVSSLISSKFNKISYSGYTVYSKSPDKIQSKKNPSNQKKENNIITENIKQKKELQQNKQNTDIKNSYGTISSLHSNNANTEVRTNGKAFQKALDYYKQGFYEKTEELLSSKLESEALIVNNKMKLLIKTEANLGKLDVAAELCETALKTNKLDATLHYLFATIQQEQGKIEDAKESLKRVLYINSDFPLAHFTLGNLNMAMGDKKMAQKHYQNALNIIENLKRNELLEESDGLTAGRLMEIIKMIK